MVVITLLAIMITSLLWSVHVQGHPPISIHMGFGAVTWSVLLVGTTVTTVEYTPWNIETHNGPENRGLKRNVPNNIGIIRVIKVLALLSACCCQRDVHFLHLQNAAYPRSFGEAQRGQTHRDMC